MFKKKCLNVHVVIQFSVMVMWGGWGVNAIDAPLRSPLYGEDYTYLDSIIWW